MADEFEPSPIAQATEGFIDQVENDLRSVLKPAAARGERPTSVVFFVASPWKREVERWIRQAIETKDPRPIVRAVMERAREHPDASEARSEIPRYVDRVAPLLRSEPPFDGPEPDELHVLRASQAYFVRRFQFTSVQVVPEAEGEPHDPMHRRDRARPMRPAFYLGASVVPGRTP